MEFSWKMRERRERRTLGRGYLHAHVFANLRQESERGVSMSQPHETIRCDPLGAGMGLVDMRLEHGDYTPEDPFVSTSWASSRTLSL